MWCMVATPRGVSIDGRFKNVEGGGLLELFYPVNAP